MFNFSLLTDTEEASEVVADVSVFDAILGFLFMVLLCVALVYLIKAIIRNTLEGGDHY